MTSDELDEALEALKQTPASVQRFLSQLPVDALRIREQDEFSPLENVCHLRDIEIEGYGERIKRIIKEDNPSLPDIDGARLALERNYNSEELSEALEAFRAARQRNLELLRGLSTEELAREGMLENVGVISLAKLMEMMVEHDEGHLAELQTIQTRAKSSSSGTTGT